MTAIWLQNGYKMGNAVHLWNIRARVTYVTQYYMNALIRVVVQSSPIQANRFVPMPKKAASESGQFRTIQMVMFLEQRILYGSIPIFIRWRHLATNKRTFILQHMCVSFSYSETIWLSCLSFIAIVINLPWKSSEP